MNASVNYGNFIDLLLKSDDDYEPYGLSANDNTNGLRGKKPEMFTRQEPLNLNEKEAWHID